MSEWLRIQNIADSCHVSERLVWKWIADGLRNAKVGGVTLIKSEWLNEFLESFEVKDTDSRKTDDIVEEVMGDLT